MPEKLSQYRDQATRCIECIRDQQSLDSISQFGVTDSLTQGHVNSDTGMMSITGLIASSEGWTPNTNVDPVDYLVNDKNLPREFVTALQQYSNLGVTPQERLNRADEFLASILSDAPLPTGSVRGETLSHVSELA